jgi:hypothetical protein
MPELPLTGGCLCGGVRFEISEPLVSAGYCHCTRCQRRTGTGASPQGRIVPGSLRVTAGESLIKAYEPRTASRRCSAPHAGRRSGASFRTTEASRRSASAPSTATLDPPVLPSVRRVCRALGAAPGRRPRAIPRSADVNRNRLSESNYANFVKKWHLHLAQVRSLIYGADVHESHNDARQTPHRHQSRPRNDAVAAGPRLRGSPPRRQGFPREGAHALGS